MVTDEYWKYLEKKQAELKEKVAKDHWRLRFHLMPETGWMNDPNGVCQFKGTYHFYHQYVPTNPHNGEAMHWGHKTSTDLVHFKEEPLFLSPVNDYDKDGVYSGSAFVEGDYIHYFYTGNVKLPGTHDYIFSGREQHTVHVVSKDGYTIEKQEVVISSEAYPENMSTHVRDPKVFKRGTTYYMLLGARNVNNEGNILIYTSDDLECWTYGGVFFGEEYSLGYMWECPDYFELGGKEVLVFSPQGIASKGDEYNNAFQSGYIIGKVDWETLTFKEESDFVELDRGFDFYAPQTFEDEHGRRIMFGWMGMVGSLPEYTNPTPSRGWQHAATLPRELVIEEGCLKQYPLEAYQSLRGDESEVLCEANQLQTLYGDHYELLLMAEQEIGDLELRLKEDTKITYSHGLLTLKHGVSGCGRKERNLVIGELRDLHLFVDSSSVELFVNNGSYVMTSRMYPKPGEKKITLIADKEVRLTKWELS